MSLGVCESKSQEGPGFPIGWYSVGRGRDLGVGEVRDVKAFDRELEATDFQVRALRTGSTHTDVAHKILRGLHGQVASVVAKLGGLRPGSGMKIQHPQPGFQHPVGTWLFDSHTPRLIATTP